MRVRELESEFVWLGWAPGWDIVAVEDYVIMTIV